jgi:Pvc16 N-terminal domain
MSNQLAIAAVTATLRSLLVRGVGIPDVTARPLDNARRSATGHQLNLFLYQVLPDGGLRNQDMPGLTKPGEKSYPALPLMLYYLLTAYSDDEDDTAAHRLLGEAMGVLHDHPLLGAAEIRNATSPIPDLADSDLHQQIERVRINLQPLMFEDMSKLWTTFQTHYRVSAAYQVSVVLIESTRPPRTPLPVLKRGEDDKGVTSQPDVASPFPVINSIELPGRQLSAQPGDVISIVGSRLASGTARLRSSRVPSPPQPATASVSDAQLDVTLPNNLAAGFYTIAVELTTPRGAISSNELPLAVAPVITTVLPMVVARVAGTATINLTSSVDVLLEQRVSLLVGDFETRRVLAPAPPASDNAFEFVIETPGTGPFPLPIGEALLTRLRVDGVDSEIIKPLAPGDPEITPFEFDTTKTITIN